MVHKTVLKVDVSCNKCKKEVIGVVSDLEGVNKIEADSEKDTLTVIGETDPYEIIRCLRKAGKKAVLVTVGPPPKKEETKPEQKHAYYCTCSKSSCSCTYLGPVRYPNYEPVGVIAMPYQEPAPSICSIM